MVLICLRFVKSQPIYTDTMTSGKSTKQKNGTVNNSVICSKIFCLFYISLSLCNEILSKVYVRNRGDNVCTKECTVYVQRKTKNISISPLRYTNASFTIWNRKAEIPSTSFHICRTITTEKECLPLAQWKNFNKEQKQK